MATEMDRIRSIKVERDELHEQMGGGFPLGTLCYLEGPHSSGKSAMAQRFLYGLLENGHTATYISTELAMNEFVDQMYSLDYRIAGYLLQDKLNYVPVYPLLSSMRKRDNFLEKLMNARSIFQSDIIFIDTLSSLVGSSVRAGMTSFKFLQFLKRLSALGKVIVMTVDPDEMPSALADPFKSAATAYWVLNVTNVGGTTARILKLFRFGSSINPFEDTIGFKISPGVGIIIEITTVG
jgi:flagellar protein FlaH